MKRLAVDSNFWIGLCDRQDNFHAQASRWFVTIKRSKFRLVVPWPCMYEVLSTRAGRRQQYVRDMADAIASLEKVEAVDFVGDEAYREDCLLSMFRESSGPRLRDLSLADRVIRSILGDPEIRVQALLTSNVKDFADVCRNRRVTLEDLNG